ncbi:unnamed protein product [Effrenium voratum]|nr:unnamed protein product [Effrenium voratum]
MSLKTRPHPLKGKRRAFKTLRGRDGRVSRAEVRNALCSRQMQELGCGHQLAEDIAAIFPQERLTFERFQECLQQHEDLGAQGSLQLSVRRGDAKLRATWTRNHDESDDSDLDKEERPPESVYSTLCKCIGCYGDARRDEHENVFELEQTLRGGVGWSGFLYDQPTVGAALLVDALSYFRGEAINVLITGGADIRHVAWVLSDARQNIGKTWQGQGGRKHQIIGFRTGSLDGKDKQSQFHSSKEHQRVRFFLHETQHEVLARHLLFLQIVNNKALSIRERMEVFLSLYGNTLVRERDCAYVSEIAPEFVELVTENSAHPLAEKVDLSQLKFKDRDLLQDVFKGWFQDVPFDIEALREQRCRGYYRTRYDYRKNLMDYDYQTFIKEVAGIIHWFHYKQFGHTGVAFETRLASYSSPNRSLASYTEAKDRSKGTTVQVRGFWGDIINSPELQSMFAWLRYWQDVALLGTCVLGAALVRAKKVKSPKVTRALARGTPVFDPLNLTKDEGALKRAKTLEMVLGRVAMLAAVGVPSAELWHEQIADAAGLPNKLNPNGQAPTVFNGGTLSPIVEVVVVASLVGLTASAVEASSTKKGVEEFDSLRVTPTLSPMIKSLLREEARGIAANQYEPRLNPEGRFT